VSADYRTENLKGYGHLDKGYIHVDHLDETDGHNPVGDFAFGEIAELAQMAAMAWPAAPGVEVRYVIEAHRPGQSWAAMWSARVADDDPAGGGVSLEFAEVTFAELPKTPPLEWRLVRRTTITHDETLGG
jgi:hypothetical protein